MTDLGEDRLSWVREDAVLGQRLEAAWPTWDDPDDSGLATTLDGMPDWAGWDGWSADDKRSYLMEALDQWYPPSPDAGQGPPADRIAWVREDPQLVARLDASWAGWDDPDESGLAATLDQAPDWAGWEGCDPADLRDYLARTLDAWYPGEPADQALPEEQGDVDVSEQEPAAEELGEDLAAALAEALAAVPEAANLSEEELSELLTRILNEEIDALPG